MRTFLLVILFVSSNCFAQFSSKYVKATITLKNGEIINTNARVYEGLKTKSDANKKSKIPANDIDFVEFFPFNKKENKTDTLKLYSFATSQKKVELGFKLYESEKITIYGRIIPSSGAGGFNGGSVAAGNFSNFNYNGSTGGMNEYYCYFKSNNRTKEIYYTHSLKSFKAMAIACFKSCPALVEKLEKKEFTEDNMKEIGDFYTNQCN